MPTNIYVRRHSRFFAVRVNRFLGGGFLGVVALFLRHAMPVNAAEEQANREKEKKNDASSTHFITLNLPSDDGWCKW